MPGQYRDLRAILDGFAGRLHRRRHHVPRRAPARPRPTRGPARAGLHRRHALCRRAAATRRPSASAFQPGTRAPAPGAQPGHELGGRARRAGRHPALRPPHGWPRPARPRFRGYVVDLPPKVVDAYLQATVAGFEYPRSDLAPTVRFVGPDPGAARPPRSTPPPWWGELGAGRPVVHVTQGTLDNADLAGCSCSRRGRWRDDDVLVVATTGGPDPAPLRPGLPANARLERFIPHDLLLPHVDVMVTNGGYGGVQQALANGVPARRRRRQRGQARGGGAGAVVGRRRSTCTPAARRRRWSRAPCAGCCAGGPIAPGRARALQAEIAASDPLGDDQRGAGRAVRGATRVRRPAAEPPAELSGPSAARRTVQRLRLRRGVHLLGR